MAFEIHTKKIPTKKKMTVQDAIEKVEASKIFFERCKEDIQNHIGSDREVQGPDGTISPQSRIDLDLVLQHLHHLAQLQKMNPRMKIDMGCVNDLFTEHFFADMRSGSDDTPDTLDFSYKFNNTCRELVKRNSKGAFKYYTKHYTTPNVQIDKLKVPRINPPTGKKISEKQLDELKEFQSKYGQAVRQKTVRDFSTKDNPGTLPVYVYEKDLQTSKIDFLDTSAATAEFQIPIVVKRGSFVLAKRGYCPPSPRISSIFLCRVTNDIEEGAIGQVEGEWFAQDDIDSLLFVRFADGVITLPSICDNDVHVNEVENDAIRLEEDRLYELISKVNTSEETLTAYEMEEVDTTQDDTDTGEIRHSSRSKSRPRALHNFFLD